MQWTNRSMCGDQFECVLGECFPGWNFVPGRRAGRMRQRNQVEAVARIDDAKFATNYVFQFYTGDEPRHRQAADWNNETGLQNPNFIIHPQRTVANLTRRWDTVGSAGIFAGEAAAHGGEINLRSNGCFVHAAKLFEPTKECFAGSVRKRSFQRWFPRTRRLPNDHYVAHDRAAGNRLGLHPWTATAFQKLSNVSVEQFLSTWFSHSLIPKSGARTRRTPKALRAK
jgi:hypothetical protein